MRRTFAVALFVAAFVASTAVAQAVGPHWIWSKPTEETPQGKIIPVTTEATLTFAVVPASGKKMTTKCFIKDTELIENPFGGGPGVDEMTEFTIGGCTGKAACSTGALISFTAVGLPWLSVLQPGIEPIDEIKGVEIQEQCLGLVLSTYTGTLTPTVKGFSGLNFGPGSGTLEDAFKNKLTLKGTDKMIGPSPKTKIGAV